MNTSILILVYGGDERHEETILQQQSMRKDATLSVPALVSAHILMVFCIIKRHSVISMHKTVSEFYMKSCTLSHDAVLLDIAKRRIYCNRLIRVTMIIVAL